MGEEKPLANKVAIVTGSGSGMGVGIALALAKAGADVALIGRTRSSLENTERLIAEAGGRSLVVPCDVTDRNEVEQAVATVTEGLGAPYILVNNAITTDNRPLEFVDEANLDQVIRSGIYGSFFFMQACLPAMKESGGRIMNFGSGGATMGMAEVGAYVIAKEGIRGLTKVAATGWGKYGITVNTICPMVATPLYKTWFDALDDEGKKRHLDQIPMGRMGDAEGDIGALIVFLAGPGGSYITSRTLHIDGGSSFYDR